MYEHIIHLNTQQYGGKSQISKNTVLNKTSNLADTKVHLLMHEQKEINMYVHKKHNNALGVPIHQKKQRIF
jgi:hypothetical protein